MLLLGAMALLDNAKAWALLVGAFLVAETGMVAWLLDARSRRRVFDADAEAAAAMRARTYATVEAANPGGNSPIPWVALPPAAAPQLPAGDGAGYNPADIADGVAVERG